MCCFFSSLLFFGPRLAFLVYWLLPYGRLRIATTFNTFIWPLLGLIFLPWTTLVYTFVYGPGGLVGFDWVWLTIAFLADLAGYAGAVSRRR